MVTLASSTDLVNSQGEWPLAAHFNPNDPDLDRTLLFTRSSEGQQYRESLIRSRWCITIATGFELVKIPQYLHLVDNVGFGALFVVESEDNCVARELQRLRPSKIVHIPLDLSSRPTLLTEVCEAIETSVRARYLNGATLPSQLGNDRHGFISCIYTLWDDAVCLVARVQKHFDIMGDDIEVIDQCHDKVLSRQVLERAGVNGPAGRRLETCEDARELGKELKYPIIVKPVNGAASIGVKKVADHNELVKVFPELQQEMQNIYAADELMGLTFTDGPAGVVGESNYLTTFMAEEFLEGKEYDCDIVLYDGELVYGNINEDWEFTTKWMCERGMHHPASLTKTDYDYLLQEAARLSLILGCKQGIYHVEMKWDPNYGPQLIECNPRMGGAGCWTLHLNSWKVDLLMELSFVACNIPCKPVLLEEALGLGMSHYLFSDYSGELREDHEEYNRSFLEQHKLQSENGLIAYFGLPMKQGKYIDGWVGRKEISIRPIWDDWNYSSQRSNIKTEKTQLN